MVGLSQLSTGAEGEQSAERRRRPHGRGGSRPNRMMAQGGHCGQYEKRFFQGLHLTSWGSDLLEHDVQPWKWDLDRFCVSKMVDAEKPNFKNSSYVQVVFMGRVIISLCGPQPGAD